MIYEFFLSYYYLMLVSFTTIIGGFIIVTLLLLYRIIRIQKKQEEIFRQLANIGELVLQEIERGVKNKTDEEILRSKVVEELTVENAGLKKRLEEFEFITKKGEEILSKYE